MLVFVFVVNFDRPHTAGQGAGANPLDPLEDKTGHAFTCSLHSHGLAGNGG